MKNLKHFTMADIAEESPVFRHVLWTGEHTQLVIMTIPIGGEIGEEVHENTDQVLSFIGGTGEGVVGDETHHIDPGDVCVVPAGTRHNFRNTGDAPLVLYTVYGPAEHAAHAVHATKEDADAAEESGKDTPPTSSRVT